MKCFRSSKIYRDPKRRGVATVEFALALPLLLLFFAIAADYSRLFWYKQTIIACAYAGASYAARADSQEAGFEESVRGIALLNAKELGDSVEITTKVVNNARGKACIDVTAKYSFRPIMKLPLLPQNVDLSHTARVRQIVQVNDDEI